MKNITFFDHMKCIMRNGCNTIEHHKPEVKKEEVKREYVNQDTVSKLNFQLFDIDQVFAN